MRLKLVLIVIGGVVAFMGFQEFQVGRGSTPEPEPVALADLEKGKSVTNNHLHLDKHYRLFSEMIYEYKMGKHESGPPKSTTQVTHAYYPIVSEAHPFMTALGELAAKYENFPDDVPDEEWPNLSSFTVLVKTESYKTVGSLPPGEGDWFEGLNGLVVNRIQSLDSKEEKLLRGSFPSIQLDKVVIIEENRRPKGALFSFGMMGGGAVLILIGIAAFFLFKKSGSA